MTSTELCAELRKEICHHGGGSYGFAAIRKIEELERDNQLLRLDIMERIAENERLLVVAKDFATSVISVSSADACRAAMKFLEQNP